MFNFNGPAWEGTKELLRWAVFFVISWLITATLGQISLVPENYTLNIWVFSYNLPLQLLLTTALTSAGRFADKYMFAKSKEETGTKGTTDTPKGILPF